MKKNVITAILLFMALSVFAQNNNTYQYDNLNRLIKTTYPNSTVLDYSYDQLGNRTSKIITSTAPVLSDLIIQNQSLNQTTFAAGATIIASCKVANTGSGTAGGNYTKLFLSSNQTYEQGTDIELGSVYKTSIAASGYVQLSTNITIPSGTAAGNWYILFFADASTQISETNETNNIANVPITVITCANMLATSNSTNASCGLANGTANVTVGGGNQPYTYQWSSGQTTANISSLSGGNYYVTITDFYGCTKTSNVTVNIITPPSLTTASSPSTCGNNNGTATANVSGGTSPYTYLWNNGLTSSSISNLPSGSYSVTVTDASSCAVNGSVVVSSPGNLSANINSTIPTCGASNGALTASVTGGTQPYTFNWSNASQTQTISGLQAGSYTVTITDASNCNYIASYNLTSVNNMSVSFSTQSSTCGNSNGTATAIGSNGTGPYTYHWSNGQIIQTATNLAPGAYNVTVTDANSCTTVSYATINAITPPSLNIISTNTSCSSNTGTATVTVINGTPNYSYLWSNGQTNQTATGLGAGQYFVTVSDVAGCNVVSSVNVNYTNQYGSGSLPTNGLVAYYPFDGNANDMSGNNNNGTVNGATLTTDRFMNPNSAYNFAGISNPQTISVPNSTSLQFTNAATFSFWIYMNSYQGMNGYGQNVATGYHILFAKDYDQCCITGGIGGLANGEFTVNGGTGSGGISVGDTVPNSSINQWINLTYVITNSNYSIYANGNLVATKTGTMSFTNPNTKNLWFGRLSATWYPFNGKMDDIRIYNRALNNTEILQIFQGSSTPPALSVNLGHDTTICANQPITLNAGSGFNSYNWSNNEVTQSINLSNLNSGTHQYIVTVTACGSTANDTININVNALPDNPGIISGNINVCGGQTSLNYVVPVIPNATSYSWALPTGFTGTSNTNNINVTVGTNAMSGNISVTGHNGCGNGIASNLSITVNQIPAAANTISGANTICPGQSITYTIPPILNADSYSWTLPSGASGTSSTNSITVLYGNNSVSGNINVYGQSSCGNGQASNLYITVSQLPVAAGSINGPASVCEGQSITYTVPQISNADSYVWSSPTGVTGNSNTNSITLYIDTNATNGYITVYGHSGCGDGMASYIPISIDQLPGNAGPINGTTTVCIGSSVTFSIPVINNASSYIWTLPTGADGVSFTNSITVFFDTNAVSGNIIVKGHSGCGDGPAFNQYIVVNPKPSTPTITQNGNVLTSNSSVGNQWYISSGIINGATNQNYTTLIDGYYYDIVTINGCSSEPSNLIFVNTSSIEEIGSSDNIKLYPNPVNEELYIEINGSTERIDYEIINSIGQILYRGNMINKSTVDMTPFSDGVYIIRFIKSNSSLIKKFIKN